MKKLFTFFTILAVGTAVQAQTVALTEDSKTPVTKVEAVDPHAGHNHGPATTHSSVPETAEFNKLEHDFGKIPQGKPVTYQFEIKNAGKTAMKIDNVQAACGCTTPEWSRDDIAPGATSKITVGYNAAAEGPFSKTITVNYNGGASKVLTIKGEVWKTPATSAPENGSLNNLKN
jgi:hypothetical protein